MDKQLAHQFIGRASKSISHYFHSGYAQRGLGRAESFEFHVFTKRLSGRKLQHTIKEAQQSDVVREGPFIAEPDKAVQA